MKNLCELVEQSREGRERAGKSREKEGKVRVFPIFDEARRAAVWDAGAVLGAQPTPEGRPKCKRASANKNGIIQRNANSKMRRKQDEKKQWFLS